MWRRSQDASARSHLSCGAEHPALDYDGQDDSFSNVDGLETEGHYGRDTNWNFLHPLFLMKFLKKRDNDALHLSTLASSSADDDKCVVVAPSVRKEREAPHISVIDVEAVATRKTTLTASIDGTAAETVAQNIVATAAASEPHCDEKCEKQQPRVQGKLVDIAGEDGEYTDDADTLDMPRRARRLTSQLYDTMYFLRCAAILAPLIPYVNIQYYLRGWDGATLRPFRQSIVWPGRPSLNFPVPIPKLSIHLIEIVRNEVPSHILNNTTPTSTSKF